MKARDLLALKAELKIRSSAELQRRLGISETAWRRWMNDPDRELPHYFGLAAAALVAGISPYKPNPDITTGDLAYYGGSIAKKVYGEINKPSHEEQVKALIWPDA